MENTFLQPVEKKMINPTWNQNTLFFSPKFFYFIDNKKIELQEN